jgi:histidine ammonia-lyase
MLDPRRSEGLPAFLSPRAGVNSGFMIPHYTAAALAEENRRLATPASTGSLPTSAMQEDHNSMGWSAGLKLRQLIENVSRILAVEAACAAQGLDLRRPLTPGRVTGAVLERIRQEVPFIDADTFMAPYLQAAEKLVKTGNLVQAAEEVVGPLR